MLANKDYNLIIVLGPTASGKTRLGVGLARALGGEIISADSRQVFRGMDIGTGKDLSEYGEIPCHLIDILDPGQEFSLFAFHRLFHQAFAEISGRGRLPLLVGGAGLYLDAVIQGYQLVEAPEDPQLRKELADLSMEALRERLVELNPRLHNTTDLLDRKRLIRAIEIAARQPAGDWEPPARIAPLIFGIRWERDVLRQRISERLLARINEGMIEEAARLLDAGVPAASLDYYGLEYRYLVRHLKGELGKEEMVLTLNRAINEFSRQQEKWFRRMERRGVQINWLDGAADPLAQALELLGRAG